jgi:uncharacterized membrane protein YuzA (DUF378 family)
MSVKYDKDFLIFENGTFKNWDKLNDAGIKLLNVLRDLFTDLSVQDKFYRNVKYIYVNSQDRTKRNNNHSNGQAIDIQVQPLGLNLWLFDKLRQYKYTCYISSFNRHIHFDLREKGFSGVEALKKPGATLNTFPPAGVIFNADGYNIDILDPAGLQTYLYKYYEAWKLSDLKVEIWAGLNSPFIGVKKVVQNTTGELKEWADQNLPDLDMILYILYGIAGLVVLSILKDNNKKIYMVKE